MAMNQKEVSFASKRAQVTIFIILGIVIFLIFVFLFLITARIKQAQLLGEKEEVLGRAFNKEALRLFVNSCLEQSLEQGISLLGQDGTIWQDQGGPFPFQENSNGIVYGGAPVAYGIRQEQSDPPNLYPCNTPLFPDSGFCPYRFPDITVGFGELAFPSIRSYEKDLENFLKKEAVSCVKEWIQDEIYPGAQIVGEETVQMHVDITDTSLVIDARYPLTFEAAGQEFFHLSEFGFVYSSKLGSFLKAAIIEPLRLEKKYVDFDYERDVMKEEGFNYGCPNNELHGFCPHATFADVLNRLQVSLDVAIPDEATGDTVFTFLVQEPNAIIKNQPTYAFSIAVQNRPPALDYVGESQCQDTFDVLVVQDRQEDLVLPLSAQDPDDDELLAYTLRSDGIGHAKVQDNALFIPLARLQTVSPNTYTVSVGVSDVYAAEDWQDIRIFVTGSLLESCP